MACKSIPACGRRPEQGRQRMRTCEHHTSERGGFHPAGEGACDVEFFISYEFRSRTLGLVMGAMFDAAFRRFSAAFERRADQIYGAKAG